jgi:hypothetical protein
MPLYDKITAANGNGGRVHIARLRDSVLRSLPDLEAERFTRLISGFIRDGLAHDESGPVHAAGSSSTQSGQHDHYATLSAVGLQGEKMPVKFRLKTVMQARADASAQGRDAEFGALLSRLRRVGMQVRVDEPLDVVELNRCIKAHRAAGSTFTAEQAMELKTLCFAAGILAP